MKKIYMVRIYSDEIYEMTIERETEKCVWYTKISNVERKDSVWDTDKKEPVRLLKSASFHDVFDTIDEAVQHIRQRYARAIECAEKVLQSHKDNSTKFEETAKVLLGK